MLSDGLYQVKTSYLCAGFVVEDGAVTMIAPILRGKFHYWKTIAKEVSAHGGQSVLKTVPG